ncbi:MAG: DUF192 domain-containing protein [Gemmatimonadetes bacterium]|nr:DUF192 domain-containing protein [Gemmatimonadota bacterium]
MKQVQVVNTTRGSTLGTRVGLADRWWLRLRGLLGRPALAPGEGMLLTPCSGVHMVGMTYPIDVAFLDRAGAVVALYHGLAPRARSGWHPDARDALELPEGTLRSSGTLPGDLLVRA